MVTNYSMLLHINNPYYQPLHWLVFNFICKKWIGFSYHFSSKTLIIQRWTQCPARLGQEGWYCAMCIDFKFICLTKSLTHKFILCHNIINNESITVHNVPINESEVSVCFIVLDAVSDLSPLSESGHQAILCLGMACHCSIAIISSCASVVLSCTSLSTLCFSWSHKCSIGFKSR